jgi:hypothetical protein
MHDSPTVLKITFALVADRRQNTVVFLDVEARVRKTPVGVISSSSEAVVFTREKKVHQQQKTSRIVSLHEEFPEDEDPLQTGYSYNEDVSSIDSGSTEPNPDLQVLQFNYPSDETAVFPLPPGHPINE